MPWYFYLLEFLGGALLANGVPHFVQGISGDPFQSPFASPPGVGESSPLSNVLWGLATWSRARCFCISSGRRGTPPLPGGWWGRRAADGGAALDPLWEGAGGQTVRPLKL
jgi:hypothetical protein